MKLKHEYVTRRIADETILVPIGKAPLEQNGLLTLNECGTFLWERLEGAETEQALADALLDTYEVDPETAKKDVQEFLDTLRKLNVLDVE